MNIGRIKEKLDWKITDISPGETISFLNPFSYLVNRNNKTFDEINYLGIDGMVLVIFMRVFFRKKTQRKAFDTTSMAPLLYKHCIDTHKSIYFIGSTEGSINQFIKVIDFEYPKLNILGFRNGYFSSEIENRNEMKNICELKPDYVVVGMGSPNQEKFIVTLKETGYQGISFTCGGYIHQSGNGIEYFPKIYNKLNLRWLYRIIDEPKLAKRYFLYYPKALWLILYDFFLYKMR